MRSLPGNCPQEHGHIHIQTDHPCTGNDIQSGTVPSIHSQSLLLQEAGDASLLPVSPHLSDGNNRHSPIIRQNDIYQKFLFWISILSPSTIKGKGAMQLSKPMRLRFSHGSDLLVLNIHKDQLIFHIILHFLLFFLYLKNFVRIVISVISQAFFSDRKRNIKIFYLSAICYSA